MGGGLVLPHSAITRVSSPVLWADANTSRSCKEEKRGEKENHKDQEIAIMTKETMK